MSIPLSGRSHGLSTSLGKRHEGHKRLKGAPGRLRSSDEVQVQHRLTRHTMKSESIISSIVGLAGVSLFTVLLVMGRLSEAGYVGLMIPLALVCIVLLCLPRLRELDLKNLKVTLDELRQVKSEIEEVKAGIAEIYGGIENLRRQPMVLDDAKMKELGLEGGHIAAVSAVMRYTAGCFKRERERLARVFVSPKDPEKTAEAILDSTLDERVFKWNGPEVPLDSPPKSVEERKREKEDRTSSSSRPPTVGD